MTSDYKDVAGCTVALVVMPFAVIADGYVLSVVWSWFMVPTLHLPALGIAQSMGVALVVGILTHQESADSSGGKSWGELITGMLSRPLMALLLGGLIRMWM